MFSSVIRVFVITSVAIAVVYGLDDPTKEAETTGRPFNTTPKKAGDFNPDTANKPKDDKDKGDFNTDTAKRPTGDRHPGDADVPNYFCPMECSYCQKLASSKARTCRTYDSNGGFDPKVLKSIQKDQLTMIALEEVTAMPHFMPNAQLATCGGMVYFLRKWSRLSADIKQKITSFLNSQSVGNITVDAAEMRSIPGMIFTVISPEARTQIFQMMSNEQKKMVCKSLKTESCMVKRAILQNVDCFKLIMSSGTMPTTKDIAAMVDMKDYRRWTTDTWTSMLTSAAPTLGWRHFKAVPIDLLIANMANITTFCGRMRSEVVKVIAMRTKQVLLGMSSVPDSTKDTWTTLMEKCGADPKMFDGVLNQQEIMSKVDMSTATRLGAVKYVKSIARNVDLPSLSALQIKNLIKGLSKKQMMDLDPTQLQMAACDHNLCETFRHIRAPQRRLITKVYMKNVPALFDLEEGNNTNVACIKCMIRYLPQEKYKTMGAEVMRAMFTSGDMGKMEVTDRVKARFNLKAAKSVYNRPNGRFASDELVGLGSTVLAFRTDDLDKIESTSMNADVLSMVDSNMKKGGMKLSRAVRIKFAKKFKSEVGVQKLLESSFAGDVSTFEIENTPVEDIINLDEETENNVQVNEKQAKFLMKKLKAKIGSGTTDSSKFTLKRIMNLGSLVCGFTKEDIRNLTRDGSFIDIINTIADKECPTLMKALHEERKSFIDFDNTDAVTIQAETTSTTIGDISPPILAQHSIKDLEKYGASVCGDIVEKIASVDLSRFTIDDIQEKWKFHVRCMGKENNGSITADDLEVGPVICGITSNYIQRVKDAEVLETYADRIQKCTLRNVDRQTLADTFLARKGILNGTDVDEATLVAMSTMIAFVPDDITDTIPADTLIDNAPAIMESFRGQREAHKVREDNGFRSDISDADRKSFQQKKHRFAATVISKMESAPATDPSRRKRSTVSLTCSDLQLLGTEAMTALSPLQISNFADQDFIDCTEFLGSVTGYSDEQSTALLTVATRATVYDDPSTWAPTTIYNAGAICQAMSATQIGTLNITLDAVSQLGQLSGWTTEKRKAVYDRWLSLQKNGNSAAITTSELRSLGDITCGAETSDIIAISSSVYQGSADSIGELRSCSSSQLEAFATLAKMVYGMDVDAWDSTVVSNVGTTIGGLSAGEISSLTESQIDAVDANHISYIPVTTFSGFTVAQIGTFSTAQAHATTASQRDNLTPSQLLALSNVAAMPWGGSSGAGAMMGGTSWTMTLLITLVLFHI